MENESLMEQLKNVSHLLDMAPGQHCFPKLLRRTSLLTLYNTKSIVVDIIKCCEFYSQTIHKLYCGYCRCSALGIPGVRSDVDHGYHGYLRLSVYVVATLDWSYMSIYQ